MQVGTRTECWGDVRFSNPCWLVSSKSNNFNLFNHHCISMALLPDTWLAASWEPRLTYFDPGMVQKPCTGHHWLQLLCMVQVRRTHQVSEMIYQSCCLTFMLVTDFEYTSLWHDFLPVKEQHQHFAILRGIWSINYKGTVAKANASGLFWGQVCF